MKYKLTNKGVQDTETGGFITNNPTNRDWRKYQKWLKKPSNNPDPEFTTGELAVQKQREIRQVENSIVDMQLKMNAAQTENFTGLADEIQVEIAKLRMKLEALQGA